MSFPYMRLYTGDWLRDTLHLSCSEQGIYIKLVMYSWDQQGPCPLDERRLLGIVNARSGDEVEALRRVLAEFWTMTPDGWYQKRVAQELQRAFEYSEKQAELGRKSGEARRQRTTVEPPFNQGSTTAEPPLNPLSPSPSPSLTLQPTSKNTNTARQRAPASPVVSVSDLVAEGVQEDHARDWLRTRGKPLTGTAWKAVQREAKKAGVSVADAVRLAAEAQWRGFKAEWIKPEARDRPNGATQETSEYLAALKAHKAERPPAEVMEKIRGIGKR